MTTKVCTACKIEKDISCFYKHQNKCKVCKIQWQKSYYEENRDSIIEYHKKYYEENKDEMITDQKAYYEENKEERLKYQTQYANGHKEDKKDYDKVYRQENRKSRNEKRRVYDSDKMKTDPAYRLRKLVSITIRMYIKKLGSSKNGASIMKYLPYTMQELKWHLEKQFEPWMTWNNQGTYIVSEWEDNNPSTWKWQIDHIIPQSLLPYSSMTDDNFKKCWALNNLRPYSAKQNLIDSNRR